MQQTKNLIIHSVLSVGLLVVFFISQIIGTLLFAPVFLQQGATLSVETQLKLGSQHGTVISLTAILTFFVLFLVSFLFSKIQSQSFVKFMAITKFYYKDLLKFGTILLLLNLLFHAISTWLNLDSMQFMNALSDTSKPLWLLILAIVVVVPIYEEMMFRGFIWSGFADSVVGVWGANIITSTIFALIHLQYGMVEWLMIFCLAMLFGYARLKSGSLWLPVCLHMMNNGLAMWLFLD